MWALFLLDVSLGGSFRPGGVGRGGEGVIGGLGGLGSGIWEGIPLFEGGFSVAMSLGDSFGP